ncbi:hypothetical protein GCM10009674_31430 [Nesterenkonia xinjiangensis]
MVDMASIGFMFAFAHACLWANRMFRWTGQPEWVEPAASTPLKLLAAAGLLVALAFTVPLLAPRFSGTADRPAVRRAQRVDPARYGALRGPEKPQPHRYRRGRHCGAGGGPTAPGQVSGCDAVTDELFCAIHRTRSTRLPPIT